MVSISVFCGLVWCPRTDLNCQPFAYKATALPLCYMGIWLRGLDSNQRPLGYEPKKLPTAIPRHMYDNSCKGLTAELTFPYLLPVFERSEIAPTVVFDKHRRLVNRPSCKGLIRHSANHEL